MIEIPSKPLITLALYLAMWFALYLMSVFLRFGADLSKKTESIAGLVTFLITLFCFAYNLGYLKFT